MEYKILAPKDAYNPTRRVSMPLWRSQTVVFKRNIPQMKISIGWFQSIPGALNRWWGEGWSIMADFLQELDLDPDLKWGSWTGRVESVPELGIKARVSTASVGKGKRQVDGFEGWYPKKPKQNKGDSALASLENSIRKRLMGRCNPFCAHFFENLKQWSKVIEHLSCVRHER